MQLIILLLAMIALGGVAKYLDSKGKKWSRIAFIVCLLLEAVLFYVWVVVGYFVFSR